MQFLSISEVIVFQKNILEYISIWKAAAIYFCISGEQMGFFSGRKVRMYVIQIAQLLFCFCKLNDHFHL